MSDKTDIKEALEEPGEIIEPPILKTIDLSEDLVDHIDKLKKVAQAQIDSIQNDLGRSIELMVLGFLSDKEYPRDKKIRLKGDKVLVLEIEKES